MIADVLTFEATLNKLLTHRAFSGGVHVSSPDGVDRPFGVSLSWLGLLFAVLASGSQSSNLPAKERELTSQVYSKVTSNLSWNVRADLSSLLCLPGSSDDQFHDPPVS